jgi:hypothetical protein
LANVAGSGGGGNPFDAQTKVGKLPVPKATPMRVTKATRQPSPQIPNDNPAVKGQPQLPAWVKTPEQANAYMRRGQNKTDATLRKQGHKLTFDDIVTHALNVPLGLLGGNTHQVKYAFEHPVARLQNKGPFAPTQFITFEGKRLPLNAGSLPWFGGPKTELESAMTHSAAWGTHGPESPMEPGRGGPQNNADLIEHLKNNPVTPDHPLLAGKAPAFAPKTPRIPKGATTEATAGELGKQVREGLRGAKAARTAQDKLYSAERGSRAGQASEVMSELGGQAGHRAALAKLKGELPKLQFGGFENFDQSGLDALFTHIQNHPTLRTFEKIRAQSALRNVVDGKVPTKSELGLLGQVFGKEVSTRIAASIPFWAKTKNLGLELMNVPRSIMSSFDLSAPFRQGLVSGVKYPRIFFKNFVPMVKAFGSERVYQGIEEEIRSRPNYMKMQESGLALTDLEALSGREEQFISNLAERIPVVGHGVRASGRAYTGFLTKMRADVFDYLVESAHTQGLDTADEKLLKSIARYVNSATGRGDLGALQKHAVTLNSLFFSPRLLASRLNFLNPLYYAKLDPFVRREALGAARNLVGVVGLTLFLAKMAGARVNSDPRNADFAKIRFGDTRIDILGGFQQPVRLLSQLFSGKVISSTTGNTLNLGPQGPGKLSRYDIAQRFVESKLSPVPSFIKDVGKGTDSVGNPLHWGFTSNNPAFQRMIPLLAQDAYNLYQNTGSIPKAIAGYGVGAFGVGLQTYGAKKPKARKTQGDPFDKSTSSGSVSNPFDSSSSSGTSSSNPFDK